MKIEYKQDNKMVLSLELPDGWSEVDPRPIWPAGAPAASRQFLLILRGFDKNSGNLKSALENMEHLSVYVDTFDIKEDENEHDLIQAQMHRRNPYLKTFTPEETFVTDGKECQMFEWTDGLVSLVGVFVTVNERRVVLFEFSPGLNEAALEKPLTAIAHDVLGTVRFAS